MARYIDTDLFIEDLIDYKIGRRSLDEMIKCLRNQPTADVAPVVHGEWIGDTCSICNLDWNENMVNNSDDWGYFDQMPNYCPNCGAKMDGKDGAK